MNELTSLTAEHRALTSRETLAIALLVFVSVLTFFITEAPRAFSSSELRFSELTATALRVIPASCPSNPHFLGECSVDTQNGCPAGTTWDGVQCVGGSGGGSGDCPIGTSWNGSACVGAPGTGGGCPPNSLWNGTQCISMFGADICPIGTSWDGTQCSSGGCPAGTAWNGSACAAAQCPQAHFFCSGADRTGDGVGDDRWLNNQCRDSFDQTCQWGCVSGVCLPPPEGALEIKVFPSRVRSGDRTDVSWQAHDVTSCTIDENNNRINDEWSGAEVGCSGTQCVGNSLSSPITQKTRYTLHCVGIDGNDYTDSADVNILPIFIET